ncbi:MAG: polymorphic toxin type 28 domain-containing protein [Gammaproteobacteria bacterium]
MGLWMNTFHSNKVKREAEKLAEAQQNATNQQAAQQLEEARIRKENNLAQIVTVCTQAREQITLWHQTESSKANDSYNQEQEEYRNTLDNLNISREQCVREVTKGFNARKANLILNKQNDEQRLEQCSQDVTNLAKKTQDYYGYNKLALERLWGQVEDEMLHMHCIDAYKQLKQPIETDVPKSKNYSLLVGYLRQLSNLKLISDSEFDKYQRFFHVLCNTDNINQNNDFNIADSEVLNLLQSMHNRDSQILSSSYQEDNKKHTKTYAQSLEFNNILYDKVAIVKQDIYAKYEQSLRDLTSEHDQKQQAVQKAYSELVQRAETELSDYKTRYDTYITTLNNDKDSQLAEINVREAEEKTKVNEQYQIEAQAIEQAVRNKLQQISESLEIQLRQIKHSSSSGIINAFTTVIAGAAAYFSGGLLAGVSSYIVEAVQTSLAATSLRSLERLINGKDKFGLEGMFNLAGEQPNKGFNLNVRTDQTTNNLTLEEQTSNLTALQDQFKEFRREVQAWQATAEHDLFYSLNREVSPIKPKFSDALTIYSNQSVVNTKFDCQARLGQLQTNGYRTVEWNIMLNNQAKWYGNNIMRDLDIRKMVQRLSGDPSSDLFCRDWDKSQVLSFSKTGRYKLDLPGIKHPCADALQPRTPANVPMIENRHATANNNQLVVFQQPQSSLAARFGNAALDFFMPAAYGDEFVTSSMSNTSSSVSSTGVSNYLEDGLLDSLLIGSGRSFVNVGQGIKQGCCIVGEKFGLVQPGTSDRYTQEINKDKQLYSSTPVAQSVSGKVGEFGTDMLLYSVVPAGAGVRGWRLAASSAAAGGFIGGLQPTDDGLLSTRFQNAGIGAVVGGIAGPLTGKAIDGVKGGMLKLFDVRKASSLNKPINALDWDAIKYKGGANAKQHILQNHSEMKLTKEQQGIVSSPNLRVDTSKLQSTSSSLQTASSSSSTTTKLSRETQRLLGKTDRYKSELFERAGKTKDQTTLNAAKIELQGKQIDLAIEKGVVFDHVTKVEAAQNGLLKHLKDLNARLSHSECSMVERNALETELSKASKLLDHTEQFVPRTSTPQPPNYPKPRAT